MSVFLYKTIHKSQAMTLCFVPYFTIVQIVHHKRETNLTKPVVHGYINNKAARQVCDTGLMTKLTNIVAL